MNSKDEITIIKPFVWDEKTNQSGQVIDFSSFSAQWDELKRLMNTVSAETLPKDGTESMNGDLRMGGNEIVNVQPFVDVKSLTSANFRQKEVN